MERWVCCCVSILKCPHLTVGTVFIPLPTTHSGDKTQKLPFFSAKVLRVYVSGFNTEHVESLALFISATEEKKGLINQSLSQPCMLLSYKVNLCAPPSTYKQGRAYPAFCLICTDNVPLLWKKKMIVKWYHDQSSNDLDLCVKIWAKQL